MPEPNNISNKNTEKEDPNYEITGGRFLASPLPGEEIVISGLSGAFPHSNNVYEFRDNLFNKVNMVRPNTRWQFSHPEIPMCSGTIPVINKYDAGFFGVHEKQAHSLDAMNRMFLEKSIEAIFDAGIHPSDLENSRTGVFVGVCFSESDKSWFFENIVPQSYALTGAERSMMAHRLSYFLKLKGPSYIADTACSSSLYAFEHAFRALRLGEIDNAIIGGTNLCLHPFVSLQFARLGVLSLDGSCKAFDKLGNGYARSETITAVFLQRAKNAKRIYAEVIHAKTSCDGYKEQGITYPSGSAQKDLLTVFYEECNIDRYSLSFLEAHGTGTQVGDPEECTAIDETLTQNRKTPLLIGSVKSNIGHSEPSSGLGSITKCIIGMETGFIPPNLHYTTPRDEIKGLCEGRMKVVSEKIPFEDNRGLVGINSFGFGGGNCHILLRWNMKKKVKHGLPQDDLPRLVCVSGRTEEAISSLLDEICNTKLDVEFIKLLHDIFRKDVQNHLYRGYTIVSKRAEITRSLKFFSGKHRPLYFVFGELNNWRDVGSHLMSLPVFNNSIQRFQKNLGKRIDILNVLLNKSFQPDVNHTVQSMAIQMAIIDILNLLELKPKCSFGCSFGALVSSYYDGALTFEETVNCAVIINEYVNKANTISNSNNNYHQDHSTNKNHINGGAETLSHIARRILTSNDLAAMKQSLVLSLKNMPNERSGVALKNNNSVDSFVMSLLNDVSKNSINVNTNSTILQIGNGRVQNDIEDVSLVSLFKSRDNDHLTQFLKCIGSLYELGYNPQIEKLYPTVDLPVSRGTPMISPFIKWKHDREWFVPQYDMEVQNQATHGARKVKLQLSDQEWSYIDGHVIDGRNLFPATGYLYLVWETLSIINNVPISIMQVVFENCKFLRATTVPNKGFLQLSVTIQKGTGNFEVVEGESAVVTGRIYTFNDDSGRNVNYDRASLLSSVHLPLKTKDIYKELRLRGYNYKGGFRAIQECDSSSSIGTIKWEDNWVTFIDNMLQMKILQTDSRLLYVPTYISKLTINAKSHLKWVNTNEGSIVNLPVINDAPTGTISCGGIFLCGLIASSIVRKKNLGVPVLESYKFVPNVADLSTEESARVNMQIILENALVYKVKVVEVVDDFTNRDVAHLTPIIQTVLQDQPLIRSFLHIFSKTPIDVTIEVEDKKIANETDCLLVIASNILSRPEFLHEAFAAVNDNGYIMSRESPEYNISSCTQPNITILTVHKTPTETLVLLQKRLESKQLNCINVRYTEDFSWLSKTQEALKKANTEDLLLYTENESNSGILGLVNCLRREPDCANVRCLFVADKADSFNPKSLFYADQLKKNLAVNVYKNGQWGTYRHLLLDELNAVESEHCYANVTVRADLSSLRWIEGPLRHNQTVPPEKELIHVYYAALNFRDVMTASGKINVDVITQDRLQQECVQGFEFSGRDKSGNRIMGMVTHGALSTLILADTYLTFDVPDSWSLEEAATIPVVYGTVIYALNIRAQLRNGESILIHSGSGGIGQAAIRIALHYGCKVYTTVGNQEKREFLKEMFPQLQDRHIGNSHDESFEDMIYRETGGRGVDLVLNSLAEDKLIASVRCLAKNGRFMEIGKFDMANNNQLSLLLFQKQASFHGVMLDQLFTDSPGVKSRVAEIMLDNINSGVIKPLTYTVFKFHEIEQAFRYMATGKHKGKVLVQIRTSEKEHVVPSVEKFQGIARYSCDPERTYILVGGLGGFGLELADWLILRGARKLVLTSRKGISTGYQSLRIRTWQSYGATVKISLASITTEGGCKELIEESLKLGPIAAIFNLAVVLADSIFENQRPQSFITSFGPKARATEYLDKWSRVLCPDLSEFVVFSSVSCGRGNAGQTNYGMANSVMERICEQRKKDGYPALAIEWGAIGEVGLVAEMQEEHTQLEIGGTLQQQISSCLKVLDGFLRQSDAAIVSSMVVAEKRGGVAVDNIVDTVVNILGLNDAKSVSLHSTLAELGMDSMNAVEIKTTLEREFEVFLTAKDIRTMTLARLKEIQEEKDGLSPADGNKNVAHFGLDMVLRLIGDASDSSIPYVRLKSNIQEESTARNVLLFPGIEGFAKVFESLTAGLNAHTVSLQFRYDTDEKTIVEMAETLMPVVEEYLKKIEPFIIIAYSYGSLVALEVVHILENRGYTGTIICIDGSPMLLKAMLKSLDIESEQIFQTSLLCHLLSFYVSFEVILKQKENLFKCESWDQRLDLACAVVKHCSTQEENYQRTVANGIYRRLKALIAYSPSYGTLKSNIKLYKPKHLSIQGLEEDYGLSHLFVNPVEVQVFEGNHVSILENELLAAAVSEFIKEPSRHEAS